jgi:hypothetical protein
LYLRKRDSILVHQTLGRVPELAYALEAQILIEPIHGVVVVRVGCEHNFLRLFLSRGVQKRERERFADAAPLRFGADADGG